MSPSWSAGISSKSKKESIFLTSKIKAKPNKCHHNPYCCLNLTPRIIQFSHLPHPILHSGQFYIKGHLESTHVSQFPLLPPSQGTINTPLYYYNALTGLLVPFLILYNSFLTQQPENLQNIKQICHPLSKIIQRLCIPLRKTKSKLSSLIYKALSLLSIYLILRCFIPHTLSRHTNLLALRCSIQQTLAMHGYLKLNLSQLKSKQNVKFSS